MAHEATREPHGVAMAFKLNESARGTLAAVNAPQRLAWPMKCVGSTTARS